MKPLFSIYKTQEHLTGFILRLTLAVVLLPHGCQLFLGWFGGPGFQKAMSYFTDVEQLPWIISIMVIFLQFFGALLLLLGFMSRLIAFALTILFLGMVVTSHLEHGFFMNWMGNQNGEGIEFHVLAIGLSMAILFNGSGSYSIDALLTKKASLSPSLHFSKIHQ